MVNPIARLGRVNGGWIPPKKNLEARRRRALISRNTGDRMFVMGLAQGLRSGAADRFAISFHVPAKSKHFGNHRIYQ
jgi:hypothetical protein